MKYRIIYRFQTKYTIREMCQYFTVSRSGYYRWVGQIDAADKDADLATLIEDFHRKTGGTYGYRRVQLWLSRTEGRQVNHKAILRVMNKTNQLSRVRRRRSWIRYAPKTNRFPNVLNRNFSATQPNQKWVTDITYLPTRRDGILYLSAVKDLFDGSIVAYKMSSAHSLNLVLDTILSACKKEKVAGGLTLHSDQGFQYTSPAYLKLLQRYGISPSMSRAGNPLDNASMENFFGTFKCESFHLTKPASFQEARRLVHDYIDFYNHHRLCLKTKLTPFEKRCQFA